MAEVPGSWRRHRAQWRLVQLISAVTWRSVQGDVREGAHGPVLVVANHFGGAADAVVLMDVLARRPRILADDALWRYPVARQVMEWLGAIPVHRGRGGEGTDNTDMFAACHDALADGEMVLIFPEGITREEPSIGTVRSGAARIALGARRAGVQGLRILPVGIHYDDKAAFRSSVYVHQGAVIDLDGLDGGGEGTEDVAGLTALIEQRLREAAPDYDDWREARALQLGAEAFLRTLDPSTGVPAGLRDRLGAWLARRPDPSGCTEAGEGYRRALVHAGVDDAWAARGPRRLALRSLGVLAVWLLALPYAVAGVVLCGVPMALTWAISKLRLGPAVMASVLPLVGAVLFGAAAVFWMVIGWQLAEVSGVAAAGVCFALSFVALNAVVERTVLWVRGLRNRLFTVRRHGERLAAQRDVVVAAVAGEVLADLRGEAAAR